MATIWLSFTFGGEFDAFSTVLAAMGAINTGAQTAPFQSKDNSVSDVNAFYRVRPGLNQNR